MSENILHHADCMDIMAKMPDKSIDLCITDPPYGIGMDNSSKRTKPSRPNSYTEYANFKFHTSKWDNVIPNKKYFTELFRISKNQIIWGANYLCHLLPKGYGWIYWDKMNGENNNFSDGEFAFSNKGVQSRHFKCSQFDNLKGGKYRIHPTQKPVALYKWLLTNYAKPGYKLFDSHSGSGSFRIAAYDMGFDLVSCELDADYCRDNEARFQRHIQQQELFPPEEIQEKIYQDKELFNE